MSFKYFFIFFLFDISIISSINLKDNDFFSQEIYYLIKKINRFSMSTNNEEYMNILIEKLKRYIFSHNIERPDNPKSKYNKVREKIFNFKEIVDGTYDLYSHEIMHFNNGYQVSFETFYDSYTDEEYEEIVYKMSLMSDNSCYIGVYGSKPEISFYFENYELANVIAILFNQISIWDWRKDREIFNKFHKELL